ncbi:FxsA family protein [Tessaracoccus antarcticus]|uniref:FxsA family protein n=1 Tax=Tessaracoccus antarcticus TaxID=2479848 RepID=A0A3M0GS57_9ACTN|nr:FxsA family protein [Tessaracoccus antarcticus]RMB60146.1 FxsA family protein [Tessaracoccus antarcticus]
MPETPGGRWPRRSVPALALSGFFLFILAEVALLVWVSTQIGWWTLVALMVSTVVGAYLLQREWRKAWKELGESLKTGSLPPGRTADAVLVLLGGFMLIMPGFITDVLGLLLLLPFTRPGVRSFLGWWVTRAVPRDGAMPRNMVIQGEVVEGEVVEGEVVEPGSGPEGGTVPGISPHNVDDEGHQGP